MFCHVEPTQVKYSHFSTTSLEALRVELIANVEWYISWSDLSPPIYAVVVLWNLFDNTKAYVFKRDVSLLSNNTNWG